MKKAIQSERQWGARTAIALLPLLSFSALSQAAAPDFQAFVFTACENATGNLRQRCNESVNGDLSGDSEDSLNPTQSLSFNALATEETRTRLKALQEKLRKERNTKPNETAGKEESAMSVFQLSGASVLAQGEFTELDRRVSERERGYESDTYNLQIGLDYRLTDDWLIGAMLSVAESETQFDEDSVGVNFEPGANEGTSESDSISLSLFTSRNLTDTVYVEGLASYGHSDYSFNRNAIFQESTRDISLNRAVNTSADAQGYQFALSTAVGAERQIGQLDLGYYVNLDYQKSSIDGYSERGGEGFAMAVEKVDFEKTTGTVGIRLSRPFNTATGVWVPKISVALEQIVDEDKVQTRSRFLQDASGTRLGLQGDGVDKTRWLTGISLVNVRPNGWMGFIRYSTIRGDKYKDQHSIAAGLRIEF